MNNKNLRYQETDQRIQQALFKLMNVYPFSEITIKDICREADVSKSTFYYHYLDMNYLLMNAEDNFLSYIRELEKRTSADWIIENGLKDMTVPHAKLMAEYMYEHAAEFTVLMGKNGDPTFRHRLFDEVLNCWQNNTLAEHLAIPQKYALAGMGSLECGLLAAWVESGFKESKEEFLEISYKFGNALVPIIFKK
jgi:AcrR family transcriptional regulator